jgi:hypothetical protein
MNHDMTDEAHKLREYNSFAYKCYICGNIAYHRYSRGVELKGKCGHKGAYFRFKNLDKLANTGYFGVKNLALGFIDKATVVVEKRKATAIKYRSSDAFVLVEFSDGKTKWIDSFNLFWRK